MSVKLLTEQHLEFLSLKKAAELHLSKKHIVGNHMPRLQCKDINVRNLLARFWYLSHIHKALQ